jgi:hypothetical protein
MARSALKRETYRHLTNGAAFFDRVTIQVWGHKRKRTSKKNRERENLPVGGAGRFYARCSKRKSFASGNDFQILYGTLSPFPNLSPFKITFWSGRRPLLFSDVSLALDGAFRKGYRIKVSAIELSFDCDACLVEQLPYELCTRAQVNSVKTTVYVGRAGGPWQVKIYPRTYSVGRVEFTLRARFLHKLGIRSLPELYLLRKAAIWRLVSFRQVDQSHGPELPPRIRRAWEWLGHGLPPLLPPSLIVKALREARIDPSRWVRPSPRQELLIRMQKNLVW